MKQLLIFAVLIAVITMSSCGTNGGNDEVPTDIIYTIEAPLYAYGSDDIASDLNIQTVTARIDSHTLSTSGKIENGVLSISLTAVPNSWLTRLTSGGSGALIPANQQPGVTPNTTKVGHLSLKFKQDGSEREIIIEDTETSNTKYYYNYVNQRASMTGKAQNIQVDISGTKFFYSYDMEMDFSQDWNICADTTEVSPMGDNSMAMTVIGRTSAELPETARWYY